MCFEARQTVVAAVRDHAVSFGEREGAIELAAHRIEEPDAPEHRKRGWHLLGPACRPSSSARVKALPTSGAAYPRVAMRSEPARFAPRGSRRSRSGVAGRARRIARPRSRWVSASANACRAGGDLRGHATVGERFQPLTAFLEVQRELVRESARLVAVRSLEDRPDPEADRTHYARCCRVTVFRSSALSSSRLRPYSRTMAERPVRGGEHQIPDLQVVTAERTKHERQGTLVGDAHHVGEIVGPEPAVQQRPVDPAGERNGDQRREGGPGDETTNGAPALRRAACQVGPCVPRARAPARR